MEGKTAQSYQNDQSKDCAGTGHNAVRGTHAPTCSSCTQILQQIRGKIARCKDYLRGAGTIAYAPNYFAHAEFSDFADFVLREQNSGRLVPHSGTELIFRRTFRTRLYSVVRATAD